MCVCDYKCVKNATPTEKFNRKKNLQTEAESLNGSEQKWKSFSLLGVVGYRKYIFIDTAVEFSNTRSAYLYTK